MTSKKQWREWYERTKRSSTRTAYNKKGNMIQRQKRLEKTGLPYYLSDVTPKKIIDIARRRAKN